MKKYASSQTSHENGRKTVTSEETSGVIFFYIHKQFNKVLSL